MKRMIWFTIAGFTILSLACNLSTTSAGLKAYPPTQVHQPVIPSATARPLKATAMKPAEPALPTEDPTEMPTDNPVAPTLIPSDAPPPPGPFIDTFDQANESWGDAVIVTSQAVGHDPFVKIKVSSGTMQFAISDKETYVYRLFKQPVQGSQSIQTSYEIRGVTNSGIALICKADPEMTAWFEARLNPDESKYNLYRYDKKLKDADKNPYILLGQGQIAVKDFPPAKGNTFTLSCYDRQLTLDINEGKKVITLDVDHPLAGSLSGIGTMSYDTMPAAYDFKTVTIQEIQ